MGKSPGAHEQVTATEEGRTPPSSCAVYRRPTTPRTDETAPRVACVAMRYVARRGMDVAAGGAGVANPSPPPPPRHRGGTS
eukprot:364050-Chlamydomonas_euryale.AAC.4